MTTKTNGERLVRLETDVCYIKKSIDTNTESTDRLHDKLDGFITAANDKYSTKNELQSHVRTSRGWVKSVVPWVLTAVSLFVLFSVNAKAL